MIVPDTNSNGQSVRDAALEYRSRGYYPIPVHGQDKKPIGNEWQTLRLDAADIPQYFNNGQNVGVLLGEASNGLADVDLDHPLAVELADQFLPATDAEFGRAGKRRSHRLYIAQGAEFCRRQGEHGCIVELRTSGQTVFPPSVHTSGESIEWEKRGEPAVVDASELASAVNRLADEVEKRLNTKARKKPARPAGLANVERARRYAAAVPGAKEGNRDNQAWHLAVSLVNDFSLTVDEARPILAGWNNFNDPPLDDKVLEDKLKSAEKNAKRPRGNKLGDSPNGRPPAEINVKGERLPSIEIGSETLPVSNLCWQAILKANDPPFLFRNGGLPARVGRDDQGLPTIKLIGKEEVRHHLIRSARFIRRKKVGDTEYTVRADPPDKIVEDMLAAPELKFPAVRGIVTAPFFTKAGDIISKPGYHAGSKLFYAPEAGFELPPVTEEPAKDEVLRARDLLAVELLGEFPYVSDAEKTHAIALTILPFVREMISGPTPLHLMEKPTAGTGATLLADACTLPFRGARSDLPVMTRAKDEGEQRKVLTSYLAAGHPFLVFDNLRGRFDSTSVCAAVTSQMYVDRILGASKIVSLPVRCVWLATANNPSLSDEIARRTIRIRLDAKTDQPWLRSGFRHEDLKGWAGDHRGELVWAILTLVQNWLALGRVPWTQSRLGMFESWSQTIDGILAAARIEGFLGNLKDFYEEADEEGQTWREFLRLWHTEHGTAETLVADLSDAAKEALLDLGRGEEHSQKIRLGKLISKMRDRTYAVNIDDDTTLRLRVEHGGKFRRATRWKLSACE